MKLVVTIVQDKDSNRLSNAFIESNIRATKLSSTGGFLRSGNTTFLIGIEDDRVEEVLGIIKEVSKKRSEYVTPSVNVDSPIETTGTYPIEVEVGGATVFVLPVEQFLHF